MYKWNAAESEMLADVQVKNKYLEMAPSRYLLMDGESVVRGELEDPELQAEALETIPKENRIKIQDTKTDIFVTRIIQT